MILYHEISPDNLDSALISGLKQQVKQSSSKSSSRDERLNQLLDDRRPHRIRQLGISRVYGIYAYLTWGDKLIDITDGELISLDRLSRRSQAKVLQLNVESQYIYASDLDIFDAIKQADEQGLPIDDLVDRYWRSILPIEDFDKSVMPRPEAIIVSDIAADSLQLAKS